MRHDLKNVFVALSGMLSDNKVDEALKFITSTVSRIETTENVVSTGLPAIDAIVNSKIKKAAENDVTIRYKVLINNDLLVDQLDIAVILANALDNALEAVMKSIDIDTDINAVITGKGDYISIMVKNHTSENVDTALGTTKKDRKNHGFGIRQMRMIAEKYDGDLLAEYCKEKQLFSLNVLLKNQEAA